MQNRAQSMFSSEKVVSEVYGKELLGRLLGQGDGRAKCVVVNAETNWTDLEEQNPWLNSNAGLVVKTDQSIKRRQQLGLIKLNVDYQTAKKWIQERLGSHIEIDGVKGILKQFLIEPFLHHQQNEEFYLCIYSSTVSKDVILFHHEGGVDVGNVDEKGVRLSLGLKNKPTDQVIKDVLLKSVDDAKKQMLSNFIQSLVEFFRDLHFTYLEINPLVVTDSAIHVLDVAAKLDAKAAPLCKKEWGQPQFAPALSRELLPQELEIVKLQAGTPCAMNLTVLNKAGRIWSLISGGGTSLVICDIAAKLDVLDEYACYTQFSGKLTADQLYKLSRTLIDLMLEVPHPDGKTLILSSATVDLIVMIKLKIGPVVGLVKALLESKEELKANNISLVIQRNTVAFTPKGVPTGLEELGIPIHVVSLEVNKTQIIQLALGLKANPTQEGDSTKIVSPPHKMVEASGMCTDHHEKKSVDVNKYKDLFTSETRVIVTGMMVQAVQPMLDYDFVCGRKTPSVAAIVDSSCSVDGKEEWFLWDEGRVSIPVYNNIDAALKNHPDSSVFVNFASGKDAVHFAMVALKCKQIRCILMMVGHIPDQQIRALILMAKNNDALMIGPCTPAHLMQVNFIKPGGFRCNKFGTIGGGFDDILSMKLYRPGSVGLVTRSGGLSNELVMAIARNTDGLYQGVSLGGGKYTGSTMVDHLMFLENTPDVKIMLVLGEFGSCAEYEVCEAIRSGKITKPVVAFCIGESAELIKNEPGNFGHSGAGYVTMETAVAKNQALAEAGAVVPTSYDDIPKKLAEVYVRLVSEGKLVPKQEAPPPSIPANMKPVKGKKK
ncbi:ATP-citrate synthase-like [Asterias rubens]|uniref:ATP-citrate synthase-like n=1 Tax=Asterias rubens TaxID=7604 RepID=UPI0014558394|nr:ATP-citrate synthase-like [Asterias rubens]